ncbi:unnamed protein product [Schistosoma curassoni]|nr:unnamed protein product [Schistosoma curassoni]
MTMEGSINSFDSRFLITVMEHALVHHVSKPTRFGANQGSSLLDLVITHETQGWLGHVLRMPKHQLPRHAMLTGVRDGWKKVRGGQTKTWHQCLKSLTSSLSHAGKCKPLGWGPRDYRNQWLETLGDMTQNRSQWSRCIHSLSSLKP